MAVRARAEITLSSIRDVQSVTRYYLLQSSTSAVPTKPTTNPPGGNWVTTEPTYTTGSTNSLYFTDCTVFSDGTFVYSDVSLSSSYEAAKVAYNKAAGAADVANSANEKIDNLQIGGRNLWKNTGTPSILTARNTGRAEDNFNFATIPYVNSINLKQRDAYTISGFVSFTSIDESQYPIPTRMTVYLSYNPNYYPIGSFPINTDGSFSYTFTIQTNTEGAHQSLLYAGIAGSTRGIGATFSKLKLERGTLATDWTPAPEDLENAITTSQETADGKNTVYYQNSAPTNQTFKVNDIWFDTDDENKMYHWNGSAWTAAPFGNAAFSNIDAGKVTTGTMSAARIKGDILTLGGANNVDGMLKVYDANGTLVGSFTREGLMAIAGTIGGWTINSSELTGEWQETYQHFESLLSPVSGLQFEETSTEPGFDAQFLNSIWYGTAGISFLRRRTVNNAVEQLSAFISADTNGGWDGSGSEGQITISPHLRVDGTGIDTPYMRADASYAWDVASGSYIRQPAMIMSGSTTISTGTSSKRATICTIPVEYQTGWRIIPFVTRTYGNPGATPADVGDFYYAYYNNVDHNVCIKLATVLTSGIPYVFDYMIYAVPTT